MQESQRPQDHSEMTAGPRNNEANTTGVISVVQKQHILSGTRELKQSTSVLTGHVADTEVIHVNDEN